MSTACGKCVVLYQSEVRAGRKDRFAVFPDAGTFLFVCERFTGLNSCMSEYV